MLATQMSSYIKTQREKIALLSLFIDEIDKILKGNI